MIEAYDIAIDGHTAPRFPPQTFHITAGETWRITGPSGAGKTSLMRVMAGLEPPDWGVITRRFRHPGFAFAEPRLIAHLTVTDNLQLVLPKGGQEPSDEIKAGLEALSLKDKAKARAGTLSKGQAQRVALLRALLIQPDILFLDEALGGLDKDNFHRSQALIELYRQRNAFALVEISHDPARYVAPSVTKVLPL